MYSAGDSSGDGLSGLNQFAGMSGSIDWAAMAQQWIQMHDTGNFSSMPDAPPPPNISNTNSNPNVVNNRSMSAIITPAIKKSYDEKGEADMDMDEDEENSGRGDTPPPPAPSMQLGKNREQTIMQSPAPWYMQQQSQLLGPPANENIVGIGNTNAESTPQWGSTVWPPRMSLPPPVTPPMLGVPLNGPMQNPTAHIPSLLKMNVPNPNSVRMMAPNIDEQNTAASVVDAKKRKMLPAWIREGLEKMEREKQKQLEREQSKKLEETESSDSTIYTSVGTTVDASHTVNMKYKQPAEQERSGIEGEEEAEDLDGVEIGDDTLVLPKTTSTNDDDGSATSGNEYEADPENNSDSYKGKRSYEDRLSELMIVVRTTLTELLLEVTNQEIAILAHEAVNAHKAKASSAQVIRKSALSSITGKLGLAAYDDSTGDESSDSDDDTNADNDPNNDSEEEIKASIRTKRRAFAKITDEIEERIAASAAREEQKLKYYTSLEKQKQEDELYKDNPGSDEDKATSTNTVSKPYDGDFGETTETKLQHSNGKRQKDRHTRKERTTRFSDNKDSKSAVAVAATYISKMQGVNVNPNGGTLFPISTTNTSSLAVATLTTSSSINATPIESSHVAFNITGSGQNFDDSSSVSALNKNLLNAAEAAYEKVTKSHRSNSNRSSVSRSEKRDRDHRSSRYDRRDYESDRHKERERERKSKRSRESERDRGGDRVRRHEKHQHKHKDEHTSDDDDDDDDADEKCESKTSSSDTDSTSSSSTSSSSTSHHSSHYSRTSTSSKRRREHDYDRRIRRDDRGSQRSRKSESRRSRSRSRQRSYHHHQRSSSYRHSSAEDDNDSRNRYSSSRHGSSKKRSRSRSRSTYSSSSHWRKR